ncbi:MAG: glutaminase A [Eubacteriales bacterium]|nr:glutaminase A [Eubacteriales bacterium]
MQEIKPAAIQQLLEEAAPYCEQGELASYIPELTKADPQHLGIYLVTSDGKAIGFGDYQVPFTIQSISKVASLLLALRLYSPEEVFSRVGMEPSGTPFSELSGFRDLADTPANPFINSGALAVASLLANKISFEEYRAFVAALCHKPQLIITESVYRSEMAHSERNHSLAWELKRMRLLSADVEETLDFYTKACSLSVTAQDLACFAAYLAGICQAQVDNSGSSPADQSQVDLSLDPEHQKICLSLMFTCGLYDGSGRFAVKAGLPAKSGVGGGILAILPGQAGIATFGPALDHNGNSIGGIKLLELLSEQNDWHCLG